MKERIQNNYWQVRERLRRSEYVHRKNPVLRRAVEEVPIDEIRSDAIQTEIKRLVAIAKDERNNKQVGLAHPQIAKDGTPLKIIAINNNPEEPNNGEILVFVNPKIITSSEQTQEGNEGCFSVDEKVIAKFDQPYSVTLTGYDSEGNEIAPTTFEGYAARVVFHEVNHVNGKRFVDLFTAPGHVYRRRKFFRRPEDEFVQLTARQLKRVQKGLKAQTVFGRMFNQ